MAQGSTSPRRALVHDPMSMLTEDLLLEILSRVPYKSGCRCKCVSTRWRDLIAHPDSRKKMPQTLAGFFYRSFSTDRSPKWVRHYTDISEGVYPRFHRPLSFVLPECEELAMSDSCNGLLLVRRWNRTLDYVVCNPVTEKMVTVPASVWSGNVGTARLGFNPAVSSHFHVFEFIPACVWDAKPVSGVESIRAKALGIYSSKAGAWTYRCVWDSPIALFGSSTSVFLNGLLYLSSYQEDCVMAIDVNGNCRCRVIRTPTPHSAADVHNVYLSQGQLHLAYETGSGVWIWILEDPSSDNWTLKRNITHWQLLGEEYSSLVCNYDVASIHPEHNVIFIVCRSKTAPSPSSTLISFDMDSGERRLICRQICCAATKYLPFVPSFSELLANGH